MPFKDKEKAKLYAREYYKNLILNEEQKESRKKSQKKWRESNNYDEKNLDRKLLSKAKGRATKNKLDFNLELKDIIIPTHCPILGIELSRGKGTVVDGSPSLDRIDTTLGYIKGNVHVISHKANRLKGHLSISELEKLLEYCYKSVKASA